MGERVLWGRITSVNVEKVVWALEELGLDYERRDVGGPFGGLDDPGYRAMNPNGLIPVLQDGDVTVWESSAAVRYLSAEYGSGTLWPENPRDRAISDQWADWCNTTFQPAWLEPFVQIVRTPASRRDFAALKRSNDKANVCFGILDAALAKTPYLGGDTPTYADILNGAALYRWARLDVERIDMPNVDAWHERLKARPAFVKAIEIDFSAMFATD